MNDPVASTLSPIFRDDYGKLKSEHLWAREQILLASNVSTLFGIGYVVITSERYVHVDFDPRYNGIFGPPREKVKPYPEIYGEYATVYLVPNGRLTESERRRRIVTAIPLPTILNVQKRDVEGRLRGSRMKLFDVYVKSMTNEVNLFFFVEQDAKKAYDILGTAATRGGIASREPTGNGTDIASLLDALAKLHSGGVITDSEFETKKKELLSQM